MSNHVPIIRRCRICGWIASVSEGNRTWITAPGRRCSDPDGHQIEDERLSMNTGTL